jgi:DNA repair protein RAD16
MTKVEKAVQPAELTQKLLPFQLEGLNWLVKQEQSSFKGGFLCDEMGYVVSSLSRSHFPY